MADKQPDIFRKKTLDRISSPEHLTEYLRVASPGIWSVLAAVILLLAGLFAWASVGTLETVADVTVIVSGSDAQVFSAGAHPIAKGMALRVAGEESVILSTASDGYGRITGRAEMDLPDGSYSGQLVVDSTRPIDFLLKSR